MKTKSQPNWYLYSLLLGAFLLRCLFAYFYEGFLTDTACFAGWASRIYSEGFANFYSPDSFSDYPPGYMYVLYLLGAIMSKCNMGYLTGSSLLLLKLPAIVCDIAAGALLYHIAKKYFSQGAALILSAVYLLNPAIFINSSIWGQVDAVLTLFVLLMCMFLTEGKTIPAYCVFALGLLMKPQILVFTPLILYGIYEHVFAKDFQWKKFFINLFSGLGAIAVMILLCVPFGLEKVLNQYSSTLGSYPYISVNAYNFWALLGLNWSSQDKTFLFFTYKDLGTVVIVLLTLLSVFVFLRKMKSAERYYVTGAFLIITMFLFSVRMHERYLFPGMLLLLMTYVMSRKKSYLYCYIALSASHFFNVWHVLYHYDPYNYNAKAASILTISLLMVAGSVYFYATLCRDLKGKIMAVSKTVSEKVSLDISGSTLLQKLCSPKKPVASREALPFKKTDWIAMLGITLFYACFAFYQLGNTTAPKTELSVPNNTYLDISGANGEAISRLNWYLLNEQDITFTLETKVSEDAPWIYIQDFTMKSVFSWGYLDLPYDATHIRITNKTEDAVIGEIVIQDEAGNILPVQNADYYLSLYDETDTFPEEINHLSGCYFDEIYYTRTAYEFMHGLPTYENTHPPFGKVLMSWAATILGTTPFGFRFAGALFGVLMLPFLYLLGRNITRNRGLGAFICFLFAFDFMHFAQTRLTTIDVFVTFFIIVMYYFMERYINLSFYDTALKKTWIPLGACGIAFGFGIASKWTGAYAGAGLAIIFFTQLFMRYREYLYAKATPKGNTNGISHKRIINSFPENTKKTILFCMIFFVAIPFTIYLLSYIPFVDSYRPGLLERMLKNQETMFSYHSKLEATHPYSSTWSQWPTMERPIFYYSNNLGENLRQGISSFGNPLVWWAGIPAFIYTLYVALTKKDKTAGFLCVAYLAQYLPWTLVSRCTFIYHYFPSVPFLALMIGFCFLQLKEKLKGKLSSTIFYSLVIAYAILAFALFIMFYPVLSGQPVNIEYVDKFLRWFDTWVLVIS